MSTKSLDKLIEVLPDVADGEPCVAKTDRTVRGIVIMHEYMDMTAVDIAGKFELTPADVYAALAYFHHCMPPETRADILEDEELGRLLKGDAFYAELVEKTIRRFSEKKKPEPVKNRMIEIETPKNIYKLIRLNDDQYYDLLKNSLSIRENRYQAMLLSRDGKMIFRSFPKMYVALYSLFGKSGRCYDDWKGSFSFPFLILRDEDEAFGYIMNVINIRSSIEFNLRKLIHVEDNSHERGVIHKSFEDFPRDEITYFIGFFAGFLTGYFNSSSERYDEFFFQKTESNLILFGYKDGVFFEDQYEDEKEFMNAIRELEKIQAELNEGLKVSNHLRQSAE